MLALSLGVLGCSSSDDDGDDAAPAPTTATATSDGSSNASPPAGTVTTPTTTADSDDAAVQEVTVRAGENGQEYFFEVSNTDLTTGKVKVTMTNDGPERPHTFIVRDSGGETIAEIEETEPGETGTVEFELTDAGSYTFICDLRGHVDRGQSGTFTVTE